MIQTEELLLTKEARGELKVSRAKFDRLRKVAGFPEPIRLGARSLRWKRSELLAFAEGTRRSERKSA